jgi:hypothetical protein
MAAKIGESRGYHGLTQFGLYFSLSMLDISTIRIGVASKEAICEERKT